MARNLKKPGSPSPIRVLLAGDHQVLMAGFASTLSAAGMVVAGQAKTPEDAISKYSELHPDVVVLDVRFGTSMTGMDAARSILLKSSQAKIVFFSQFDQRTDQLALVMQAYKLGALGYLTKDSDPDLVVEAIRQACSGQIYITPEISDRLARMSISGDTTPQSSLDEREMAVFKMMAEGYKNVEIAGKLKLSAKTISNTSQSVKEKLGVNRPADITRLAIRHGLLLD